MKNMFSLHCNLAQILANKEITPYKLSKETNERIGTIYKLANNDVEGARLPASLLANVCGYLDITLDELFTIVGNKKEGEQ
ncbi:hypothetical protein BK125_17265 [Paenibacillus odorifer]|uniref:HTH cro/C1-type domain-containing protein n=1 Tax=Paenibacillus odorifer TaxID=189426 RepID=A0ABX3GMC2_9BACL|nr:helix-turn-helix transcriptional regulator [Paenibacillus odorifer]OMC76803.1 hypothetical protein BK125_17265 [Paenibacillus odorifer]OMD33134.1 hypothetical protein BSO21_15645 [Paenibacillus odorifer]